MVSPVMQMFDDEISNGATQNRVELPETSPILSAVMKHLEEINAGTIKKKDLKEALLNTNDKNIHADAIVNEVFKDKTSLSRSEVRRELNQNSEIISAIAVEPI